MVRLAVRYHFKKRCAFISFNSTMVRLAACMKVTFPLPKSVSIPLWFDWRLTSTWAEKVVECFNSTMVRLAAYFNLGREGGGMFQFHYGSIGGITPGLPLNSKSSFNSTMVRLAVCLDLKIM